MTRLGWNTQGLGITSLVQDGVTKLGFCVEEQVQPGTGCEVCRIVGNPNVGAGPAATHYEVEVALDMATPVDPIFNPCSNQSYCRSIYFYTVIVPEITFANNSCRYRTEEPVVDCRTGENGVRITEFQMNNAFTQAELRVFVSVDVPSTPITPYQFALDIPIPPYLDCLRLDETLTGATVNGAVAGCAATPAEEAAGWARVRAVPPPGAARVSSQPCNNCGYDASTDPDYPHDSN